MPLHLSLGLGTQVLDIAESKAARLDKAVKEQECTFDSKLTARFSDRGTIKQQLQHLSTRLHEQRKHQDEIQQKI